MSQSLANDRLQSADIPHSELSTLTAPGLKCSKECQGMRWLKSDLLFSWAAFPLFMRNGAYHSLAFSATHPLSQSSAKTDYIKLV
jgi:hypothetical protein